MFGACMFDGLSRSLIDSIRLLSGADIRVQALNVRTPLDEEQLSEFLESYPKIVEDYTFVTYTFETL